MRNSGIIFVILLLGVFPDYGKQFQTHSPHQTRSEVSSFYLNCCRTAVNRIEWQAGNIVAILSVRRLANYWHYYFYYAPHSWDPAQRLVWIFLTITNQ